MSDWWTEEQEERVAEAAYRQFIGPTAWGAVSPKMQEVYRERVRTVLAAAGPPSVSPREHLWQWCYDQTGDPDDAWDFVAEVEKWSNEQSGWSDAAAVSPPEEPAEPIGYGVLYSDGSVQRYSLTNARERVAWRRAHGWGGDCVVALVPVSQEPPT